MYIKFLFNVMLENIIISPINKKLETKTICVNPTFYLKVVNVP